LQNFAEGAFDVPQPAQTRASSAAHSSQKRAVPVFA
jgi:hypothetical protein